MKKIFSLLCVLLPLFAGIARSQSVPEPVRKAITGARDEQALAKGIEAAEGLFLAEHAYDGYVEFLKSLALNEKLGKALVSYSVGRARFLQLKYLEESQQWEQYFNKGAALRADAENNLLEALKNASPQNAVSVYANLQLWQYHKDQQDSGQEAALNSLMNSAKEFASAAQEPAPLKKAADLLASYGEKAKARELYALYFGKFSAEISSEKLFSTASDFLAEGNIDLAESAFDLYSERISKSGKETAVPAFLRIAKAFVFKDAQPNDPAYAEKMFAAAEAQGGTEALDEEALFLRAFNLEQDHELDKAGNVYTQAAERFPNGKYLEESLFKSAVISAYVRRDIQSARKGFEKLAAQEPADAYTVDALYQLGLLKQWEQDIPAARELYTKAVGKAGEAYLETGLQAKKRLEEIESSKPLDFAARSFLDSSLGAGGAQFEMTRAEIKAPAVAEKGKELSISVQALPDPSGCSQVALSFYWSGDIGTSAPGSEQQVFLTTYNEPGTKLLAVVVISPSGVVDRAIKMIDVK
jgi:hypothetical protein